jgi:hypothetical protein
MNYQLNAIKMKSNRSLVTRIAAGTADASDITVAYRTLSYLFDAFLVSGIYVILYYAIDRLKMDLTLEIGTNTHEIRTTTQTILSVSCCLLAGLFF